MLSEQLLKKLNILKRSYCSATVGRSVFGGFNGRNNQRFGSVAIADETTINVTAAYLFGTV